MGIRELAKESKEYVAGLLELACEKLDITAAERELAESRYNAVGAWLSSAQHPWLSNASIYTQGSIRLHTTVRPIGENEFDVDLVCHLPDVRMAQPSEVRELVGARLRENEVYRRMLEPHKRAWRIVYANEFHLDITPAITDATGGPGCVLVPDREIKDWKASNPKGYAAWFDEIAAKEPGLLLEQRQVKADVEALPDELRLKGTLRRTIQVLKRHRDIWCERQGPQQQENAPISVIISTLAARAYRDLLGRRYESVIDILVDIVEAMPQNLEIRTDQLGNRDYWVPNPMNPEENFADKWKTYPERAVAFFGWHRALLLDLNSLAQGSGLGGAIQGIDQLLGERVSKSVLEEVTSRMNRSRESGKLVARPDGRVTAGGSALVIPKNTFFGG